MICETPNLDWLLLTKRPENALRMMVEAGLYAVENPDLPCPQPNLWIGTSCEHQEAADARILQLMRVPAAVRFLSCEPLLGPLNIAHIVDGPDCGTGWTYRHWNPLSGYNWCDCQDFIEPMGTGRIHWVIAGAESGHGARQMDEAWVRGLRDQCQAAGVPFFYKQRIEDGRKVELPELDGRVWDEFPAAREAGVL
jgi:protein gp37